MTIRNTRSFARQLKQLSKRHRSLANDVQQLIEDLQDDPQQGESLGSGCYKIRLAISSKGQGKSGGARVITHVQIVAEDIFLLSIFDKADRENLDDGELEYLLKHIND